MSKDKFVLKFSSVSSNESFARSVIGIFALRVNPSVSFLTDIKTAVSEAVTNCIVHGYPENEGEIIMEGYVENEFLHINVFDFGVGIENLSEALEPFYTSKEDEERSGMGFTIMKSFMDDVKVVSVKGEGTKVYMTKKIGE
ncbi:MAG: anti-sigma F factor [Clostridia bacterium]|nr:anti-sigma F factor [Clostridia bacterium]